jgi:hypothetical protein
MTAIFTYMAAKNLTGRAGTGFLAQTNRNKSKN